MKVNMKKLPGGVLAPWSDMDSQTMEKFETEEVYEIEIKKKRNPKFHRMVFSFFKFCFEHWSAQEEFEFMDERAQFEVFRNQLTCLAGYYDSHFKMNGEVRIEAKSLSYGSMEEPEFKECYNALVQAAMRNIFKDNDQETYNKLMSFF